jgi:hypothetical protein
MDPGHGYVSKTDTFSKKQESTGASGKETHLSFADLKMRLDTNENGCEIFVVIVKNQKTYFQKSR